MKNIDFLKRHLGRLWEFTKETIFPKSAVEKEIEALSPTDLNAYFPRMHHEKDSMEAILPYRDPRVRRLVEMVKYKGNRKAVELSSVLLAEEIISLFGEKIPGKENKFILTVIPASKKRLKERGFNQTKMLGEAVIKNGADSFLEWWPDLLFREKEVGVQSEIKSRKNRLQNMKGVFGAKQIIKGRTVIVIDDVTTTGATLLDARRALRAAGARKVYCLALAH